MPLYEYECEVCGHRFERIQKFSDPPVEDCPKCGEKKVHKRMSSPAFHLKGTGWYATDYARKGETDPGKASAGEKSEKSEKSDKAPAASAKEDTKSSAEPAAASATASPKESSPKDSSPKKDS